VDHSGLIMATRLCMDDMSVVFVNKVCLFFIVTVKQSTVVTVVLYCCWSPRLQHQSGIELYHSARAVNCSVKEKNVLLGRFSVSI